MGEYERKQMNQLSRAITNGESRSKQLKGFVDNRLNNNTKNTYYKLIQLKPIMTSTLGNFNFPQEVFNSFREKTRKNYNDSFIILHWIDSVMRPQQVNTTVATGGLLYAACGGEGKVSKEIRKRPNTINRYHWIDDTDNPKDHAEKKLLNAFRGHYMGVSNRPCSNDCEPHLMSLSSLHMIVHPGGEFAYGNGGRIELDQFHQVDDGSTYM